jgi:hypothetical protein
MRVQRRPQAGANSTALLCVAIELRPTVVAYVRVIGLVLPNELDLFLREL